MKWLFHFILSHSIFIAFSAAALSLQTLQLLMLPHNNYLLAFIFFAALGGYNAYWILSSFSFNRSTPLIAFLQKRASSFIVLFSAVIGMIYCFVRLNLVMYNLAIAVVLLLLYSFPVMPVKHVRIMKITGFFKTIILAAAWTIMTILVPMQIPLFAMSNAAILVFINRFLFMLMLCTIFDKRDITVDKIRGLQSIVTEIRPQLLHYVFGLMLVIYLSISYLLKDYKVSDFQIGALIASGIACLLVYTKSKKKQGYFFYYFLVDGLMFLSPLLTWLAVKIPGWLIF